MTKINVVHLRASNFYGGPERQLHFHAVKSQDSEFNITISSFTERGQAPEFLNMIAASKINTHVFKVKNSYDPRAVRQVKTFLKDNNAHILCTHDPRSLVIGYLASRGNKTSLLAFSRGYTKDSLRVRIYGLMDRINLRFADHIIAVSLAQKRKLTSLLIPDNKISVVHNAINAEDFRKVEPLDLHARYRFPPGAKVCVTVGRFSAEKGQTYLVKAARKAINANDSLRFVLYGDGPDLTRIKKLIRRLSLENEIFCPGFEKNVTRSIKGACVLINPSLSEGFPNVVLEAMALRVPVIATAVGGVPELIRHGENGYLVPPKEPDAITRAILEVTSNPDKAARVAEKGWEMISKNFSFEGQYRKLAEIYHRIMANSR